MNVLACVAACIPPLSLQRSSRYRRREAVCCFISSTASPKPASPKNFSHTSSFHSFQSGSALSRSIWSITVIRINCIPLIRRSKLTRSEDVVSSSSSCFIIYNFLLYRLHSVSWPRYLYQAIDQSLIIGKANDHFPRLAKSSSPPLLTTADATFSLILFSDLDSLSLSLRDDLDRLDLPPSLLLSW